MPSDINQTVELPHVSQRRPVSCPLAKTPLNVSCCLRVPRRCARRLPIIPHSTASPRRTRRILVVVCASVAMFPSLADDMPVPCRYTPLLGARAQGHESYTDCICGGRVSPWLTTCAFTPDGPGLALGSSPTWLQRLRGAGPDR